MTMQLLFSFPHPSHKTTQGSMFHLGYPWMYYTGRQLVRIIPNPSAMMWNLKLVPPHHYSLLHSNLNHTLSSYKSSQNNNLMWNATPTEISLMMCHSSSSRQHNGSRQCETTIPLVSSFINVQSRIAIATKWRHTHLWEMLKLLW